MKGPWGGGNLFVINLANYLTEKGHVVVFSLLDNDIDLILMTDPRGRRKSESSAFGFKEVWKYKKYVNPNVAVVHRINECDERKNTTGLNEFYLKASKVSDKVVFVSSWLKSIYEELGMNPQFTKVILSGSDNQIFNDKNSSTWDKNNKLKIITHHWSSHENKGYKTYKELDELISNKKWQNKLEFTYVGNASDNWNFINTKFFPPKSGFELAEILKKHHIYVTGSINEPSGNHHIEAAQCGLPILYLESGGLPEYCESFGVSFNDDFEEKLEEIIEKYDTFKENLQKYKLNSANMSQEYLNLFEKLIDEKSNSHFTSKSKLKGFVFRINQFLIINYYIFKSKLKNLFK